MKKLLKNKAIRITLIVLLVLAVLTGVSFAFMPSPPARVVLNERAVGILVGFSYSWVIYTDEGVILVDVGIDTEAGPVLEELKAKGRSPSDVHKILITHGHGDHWHGALAFPNAEVWAGPGDKALIEGTVLAKGFMQKFFATFMSPKPPPQNLHELKGDETLEIHGETFKVVHVPGHSPGSVAFLWGDILFSGDSMMGNEEGGVDIAPTIFSDDPEQNRSSLHNLLPLAFTRAADGHNGLVEDAHRKLEKLLGK